MSEQWFERDPLWFKRAVFYEIHIRGFFDGNDDGSGDFRGLIDKLDYLEWLGVDCLWLLPMYESPLRDGGYDISNFFALHPDYGSVDDFREFVEQAHQRGMRVIADLGLPPVFGVRDVLDGSGYDWRLGGNYVRLEPGHRQAHVLEVLT